MNLANSIGDKEKAKIFLNKFCNLVHLVFHQLLGERFIKAQSQSNTCIVPEVTDSVFSICPVYESGLASNIHNGVLDNGLCLVLPQ